ncbi:MAG: FAD binding domain-containing protein [Saprospirales bacterium]|nr:FAD binding domain-containing protein [Saprospirales bacterium]
MIEFWLNDQHIRTALPAGLPLLDFIRYESGQTGAKVGCREGDCGACLVLEGRLTAGALHYHSIVSCLTPLAKAHGRHLVTIEGLGAAAPTPVQKALVDHSAIQCGFCTPGIAMALTALCLSDEDLTEDRALAALDGNLCRCTGYQSLKRAVRELLLILPIRPEDRPISWLIAHGFLPAYFSEMTERLTRIAAPFISEKEKTLVAGGTDLYVQRPDALLQSGVTFFQNAPERTGIRIEESRCTIGSEVTSTAILQHPALRAHFPRLEAYGRLIASTPIRNMGTLGGNLANASPIADWAIFFLALDSTVVLTGPAGERELPLPHFFQGYKKLDLQPGELIAALRFELPGPDTFFHFEKVSKRKHLDIASVNSALSIRLEEGIIAQARLSAGGVSPVPLYLEKTSHFLQGKLLNAATLQQAQALAQEEISPISDIRGSETYKRLLLRQLFTAHIHELFPEVHEAP